MSKNYSKKLEVAASAESVFKSITQEVDKWWTIYSNPATQLNEVLTVRFGDTTHKTLLITEVMPNQSLNWLVKSAYIDVEELHQKDEWVGTTIKWIIEPTQEGSIILFTHEGLVPDFECYQICSGGWDYFLASLVSYLDTGVGNPHRLDE